MLSALTAVLIIGASWASEWAGTVSPGKLLAERMGVESRTVARAGSALADHLPIAGLAEAPLVVCVDCVFWHTNDRDCNRGLDALRVLFDAREGKPLIMTTQPPIWFGQVCREPLNAEIERRCKGHCILVRMEGELYPPKLHPGGDFMRKIVAEIYRRQA